MNGTEAGLTLTERRDAALSYAQLQGWRAFPCHTFADGGCTCEDPNCTSKAKHPLTANGCKDATTDTDTIVEWWHQTQGLANVAVATGVESGIIVVDIDISSGGLASLAEWERNHGEMPPTPTCQTGGGGRHFYFRFPAAAKIGNRAGIVPGIDVRGDGGYVLAPPSLHASGGTYHWLYPPETPLAETPGWLLDVICGPKRTPDSSATPAPMVMKLSGPASDLTNSPGAGQGQRHDALCRLVGVHLARGEAVEKVEASALEWGSQCDPPLGSAEVVRTVRSLAAKHQVQGGRSPKAVPRADVDDTPLPEPPPRPELHPDALVGLPGEIVRTYESHTEADPVGILVTLLACFGNAVGKGPFIGVGADSHHANLFVGLVGDTASGKGQAWGVAKCLMSSADPEWEAGCVGYGLSSGEGLVERVKDDEPDEDEDHGGLILSMPQVKRLLCYESEFAKPITAMRREGNTLSALLRAAWDSQTLEVMTRGKSKLKASNAHIGIVAHITPDELSKLLSGSVEIANGFANRFLWCHVQRSRLLPHGGDPGVLDAFARPLGEALARARAIGRVRREPAADRLWEAVYASLAESRPGAFGRATERARPQVLRLALIYALLDGSHTITEGHLRSAIAVWRYCDASARIIFGQVDAESEDPLEQQALTIIRQHPGINRKGLHKMLGGHTPAAVLVKALVSLRDRRLVRAETVSTGGRPGECWWPIGMSPVALPEEEAVATEPSEVEASERTKCAGENHADPVDRQGAGLGSIVRSDIGGSPMTLAGLFAEVQRMGGRIVRSDDGFTVQGMEMTPVLSASLVAHRSDLDMLVPPPTNGEGQKVEVDEVASAEAEMSNEEFQAALMSL